MRVLHLAEQVLRGSVLGRIGLQTHHRGDDRQAVGDAVVHFRQEHLGLVASPREIVRAVLDALFERGVEGLHLIAGRRNLARVAQQREGDAANHENDDEASDRSRPAAANSRSCAARPRRASAVRRDCERCSTGIGWPRPSALCRDWSGTRPERRRLADPSSARSCDPYRRSFGLSFRTICASAAGRLRRR